jgi:zinc and cadmium transporter
MEVLLWILLMTLINGAVAFSGALTMIISKKRLNKVIFLLVAFAAGSLLGGALIHFLPESFEELNLVLVAGLVVAGWLIFLAMEKILHWHHCHKNGECKEHPFTYLTLYGDGIHNFIDGLIIAASFLVSIPTGIVTSLLILLHEFPQEIGDYAVLIYGGMKSKKALFYNFLSQATAIVGGVLGYYFLKATDYSIYLLPIAAGGFLYIAINDLIPEVFKEKDLKKRVLAVVAILLGFLILFSSKILTE